VPVGTIGCRSNAVFDSQGRIKPAIQASLMFNTFRSYLKFTDGTRPVLTQQSVDADISWHFPNRMSFGISAGAVMGGRFSYADTAITLKAGPMLSFKYSRILLTEYRFIPFIVSAVSLSTSWTAAEAAAHQSISFLATDVRFSITAGYTIKDRLQIYLSPKVYGGPIFHFTDGNAVRGNDRYFVQAGMGIALLLPKDFMLFVNGSPLGEQSLGGGVAKIF
jgi:hypothetical protein